MHCRAAEALPEAATLEELASLLGWRASSSKSAWVFNSVANEFKQSLIRINLNCSRVLALIVEKIKLERFRVDSLNRD